MNEMSMAEKDGQFGAVSTDIGSVGDRSDSNECQLSFEQALQKLEQIVRRLESGDIELEKAIKLYEEGYKLQLHCHSVLADARLKVEKIVHDGEIAKGTELSDLQGSYDSP